MRVSAPREARQSAALRQIWPPVLDALVAAGLDGACLSSSHGTHEGHAETDVRWIRRLHRGQRLYGLKEGLRGRFGMYVPPVLEALGLAEVEHFAKNNRMRAK